MTEIEKCKIQLILHGQLRAECEREKGHKGRHKAKSLVPIYEELEWTMKKKEL